jgi:hypothetical protein
VYKRQTQNFANLINSCIEIVLNIDEGVWPQSLLQFFPAHDFAGVLQQDCKDLKRLARQSYLRSTLAQLPGSKIHFERSKSHQPAGIKGCLCHKKPKDVHSSTELTVSKSRSDLLEAAEVTLQLYCIHRATDRLSFDL